MWGPFSGDPAVSGCDARQYRLSLLPSPQQAHRMSLHWTHRKTVERAGRWENKPQGVLHPRKHTTPAFGTNWGPGPQACKEDPSLRAKVFLEDFPQLAWTQEVSAHRAMEQHLQRPREKGELGSSSTNAFPQRTENDAIVPKNRNSS